MVQNIVPQRMTKTEVNIYNDQCSTVLRVVLKRSEIIELKLYTGSVKLKIQSNFRSLSQILDILIQITPSPWQL